MEEFSDLNSMAEKSDTMDRISELPPFIIHRIMSYLSSEEVARTSTLSKRWNSLRKSFPILDFDKISFRADVTPLWTASSEINDFFLGIIDNFIKFVDNSLLAFCKLKFQMQKLSLSICLSVRQLSLVDKWLVMALDSGVKELRVDVITENGSMYTFPQTIFSAKLVSTLNLSNCRLEEPLNPIRLYSLRKLDLKRVCINEQIFQKITSDCYLLEDLDLFFCWGLKCFCIYKAPNLKTLGIHTSSDDVQRIEIAVPSLQRFTVSLTKHQRPFVFDIDRCSSLKVLNLNGTTFSDQEFHNLISNFPLLEDLQIAGCHVLKSVKISSTLIKSLSLSHCHNLEALEVDTPNLRSFAFCNYSVPISSINAPCPWEVTFGNRGADHGTPWYLKLKEFLEKSHHIKDLTLDLTFKKKNSFDLDKVRQSFPSLPCEVQKLNLYFISVPASAFSASLDVVFGICFPRTLTVSTAAQYHKSIKRLYKELKTKDVSCCKFHSFKCWCHNLKCVLFESFMPFGDKKSLDINSLMKAWPNLPDGYLSLHLEWSFDVPIKKA